MRTLNTITTAISIAALGLIMTAPAIAATAFGNTGTLVQTTPPSDDAQSFGDGSTADGGAYYYTFTTNEAYKLSFVDAGTLNAAYVDNPFTVYSGAVPGAGTVVGASSLGVFAEGLTEILPAGTYNLFVASTTENEALTGSVSALTGGVPEPAAWALMLVGLGAVGGAMRRTRQTAVAA